VGVWVCAHAHWGRAHSTAFPKLFVCAVRLSKQCALVAPSQCANVEAVSARLQCSNSALMNVLLGIYLYTVSNMW
jgi:hypothetical protein